MDPRNNIATDLFYKIRSRFSGLKLGTEEGTITINPEEARFFDFDYMEEEKAVGHVSISLAEPNSMKIYFSHGITETMDSKQKNNWYGFLKELRQFAKRRLLAFDTRDIAKDNLDRRDYAFLSQNAKPKSENSNAVQAPVGESVMNESTMYGTKTMSYQKLMDTRLIIKHSQAVMDDTQPGARTRHISALFVENQDGERFKYPFIHLAGARAMQRHVANGGVPYDDIGKSIIGMSEEIAQLKSFGNYVVRNDLMNSDTNNIVERSSSYLNSLRETIAKLGKQSHYEAYKESFQAQQPVEVPDEIAEDFTEKFTVKNFKEDIKSVFPVLYRLMQEENTIGYDDIVAMTAEQIQNDDAEIDESPEAYDPFEKFESWAMGLGEASGITSDDDEEKQTALQKLQELVGEHFPAGVDGTNAIESLKGIIEDAKLFQAIKEAAKEDPDTCVRPLVKEWLEQNAPDVVAELDFGDMEEEDPMQYANDAADADAEHYGKQEGVEEASQSYDAEIDEWPNPKFDPAGTDDENDPNYQPEVIPVGVNYEYQYHGKYRAASWGYHGGEPEEFPELEVQISEVVNLDTGEDITKEVDLGKVEEWLIDNEIPDWSESQDDYDDYDDRDDRDYDRYESADGPKKSDIPAYKRKAQGGEWKTTTQDLEKDKERNISSKEWLKKSRVDVNEVAEFIHSFYDKQSGTFPKGPEGVCTMVGKKFGEQAEQIARKFVERMAPHQQAQAVSEELQADDGEYYDNADDFFSQFESDWFDDEVESDDGLEVRGYIDGKNVMVFRFDDENRTSGYGVYNDDSLQDESATSELERIKHLSGIAKGINS